MSLQLRKMSRALVAAFFACALFFTAFHEASRSHHDAHSREHCAVCTAGQSLTSLNTSGTVAWGIPILVSVKEQVVHYFSHFKSDVFLTDASPQGPPSFA